MEFSNKHEQIRYGEDMRGSDVFIFSQGFSKKVYKFYRKKAYDKKILENYHKYQSQISRLVGENTTIDINGLLGKIKQLHIRVLSLDGIDILEGRKLKSEGNSMFPVYITSPKYVEGINLDFFVLALLVQGSDTDKIIKTISQKKNFYELIKKYPKQSELGHNKAKNISDLVTEKISQITGYDLSEIGYNNMKISFEGGKYILIVTDITTSILDFVNNINFQKRNCKKEITDVLKQSNPFKK